MNDSPPWLVKTLLNLVGKGQVEWGYGSNLSNGHMIWRRYVFLSLSRNLTLVKSLTGHVTLWVGGSRGNSPHCQVWCA